MKKRMMPLVLCFVLVLSAVASSSVALAADADTAPYSDENGGSDNGGDPTAGVGMLATTAALGKTLMSGIWSLFGIVVPGFAFIVNKVEKYQLNHPPAKAGGFG